MKKAFVSKCTFIFSNIMSEVNGPQKLLYLKLTLFQFKLKPRIQSSILTIIEYAVTEQCIAIIKNSKPIQTF